MRTLAARPFAGLLSAGLLGAGLLVGACGSRATETTTEPGRAPPGAVHIDEHHYLGAAFTVDNLTVWPVHTDAPLDVGEFLTLQEGQARGVAAVREIGGGGAAQQTVSVNFAPAQAGNDANPEQIAQTEQVDPIEGIDHEQAAQTLGQTFGAGNPQGGAQVNTLVIENTGDLPLLVCAGTIVKGGNQDRQIGQDIVIAAGETVPVDAFCVEQGRWTNVREGIANAGEFRALGYIASKGVRTKGQFLNDQSGVWQEVAAQREVAFAATVAGAGGGAGGPIVRQGDVASGTTLVDALEKADDGRKAAREACVAAIRAHFDALLDTDDAPVGFAYAVNGEAQGVRVFAHDRLFRQNLDAFASSVTVEAESAPKAETDFDAPSADDVVALVRAIEKDAEELRETTRASNFNVLKRNPVGFNGNCLIEDADGEELPVTRDWTRK